MFHMDKVFEFLSTGMIGFLTNGTIPLVIWLLIMVLLYFTARWFKARFGATKHIGKYIIKLCGAIAIMAISNSLFTMAYGYRGTAIDATHKNISLIDPGQYEILTTVPINRGHMFVVRNVNDSVTTKNNTKMIFCEDWQVKTNLNTGNRISAVGYEKVFIFIDPVEIPRPEDMEPAESDGPLLGQLAP